MNYSEMNNKELEEANQDLMAERARIKQEQQAITKVMDERVLRGFDLAVTRHPITQRRRTRVVWKDANNPGILVEPIGFEVPK